MECDIKTAKVGARGWALAALTQAAWILTVAQVRALWCGWGQWRLGRRRPGPAHDTAHANCVVNLLHTGLRVLAG